MESGNQEILLVLCLRRMNAYFSDICNLRSKKAKIWSTEPNSGTTNRSIFVDACYHCAVQMLDAGQRNCMYSCVQHLHSVCELFIQIALNSSQVQICADVHFLGLIRTLFLSLGDLDKMGVANSEIDLDDKIVPARKHHTPSHEWYCFSNYISNKRSGRDDDLRSCRDGRTNLNKHSINSHLLYSCGKYTS
jgi:hypothetical protein